MKVMINASTPVYDNSRGTATIKLTTDLGDSADVSIDFKKVLPFANLVSEDVVDFFIISATVYGIDRFIERRKNSVDGWSRELKVKLPVRNIQKWKSSKYEIEALFSFLTGDYWEVDFHKSNFHYPDIPLENQFNSSFAQVNLFSGGLDSLIGALNFLKENPKEKLLFASHYDSQMHGPKGDQEGLIKKLEGEYPGQFEYIPSVKVFLDNSTISKETTFRSRSILFIGIALLAAQAKNIPIVVPENGTVSLNYPLSSSRRSACSTRTTHPTFISKIRNLLAKIGIKTKISNPYEFNTKGEMVAQCKDQKLLKQVVDISNSCGKRGHRAHWKYPNATHCGTCMPCVYRQASLLSINDKTSYGAELNSLYPFNSKKGQDIGACLEYLKMNITKEDVKNELIINGLKDLPNIDHYVNVVFKTRDELKKWVKKTGDAKIKTKAGMK